MMFSKSPCKCETNWMDPWKMEKFTWFLVVKQFEERHRSIYNQWTLFLVLISFSQAIYDTVDHLLHLEGFSWLLWHHTPLGFLLFFWQLFFNLIFGFLWPDSWRYLACASSQDALVKVRLIYLSICCSHSHIQLVLKYLKFSMSKTELIIFLPSFASSLVFLISVNNVHPVIQVRNMV